MIMLYFRESDTGLTASCNVNCGCTTAGFEPICDNNETVYFSPCHAGCTTVKQANGTKVRIKLNDNWNLTVKRYLKAV